MGQRLTDEMSVAAAGDAPDRLAIPIDGFVLIRLGPVSGDLEHREATRQSCRVLAQQRLPPREVRLPQADEAIEACLEGAVFGSQIVPEGAITLLKAE